MTTQKRFASNVQSLIDVMNKLYNPFTKLSTYLLTPLTRHKGYHDWRSHQNMSKAEEIEKNQYKTFAIFWFVKMKKLLERTIFYCSSLESRNWPQSWNLNCQTWRMTCNYYLECTFLATLFHISRGNMHMLQWNANKYQRTLQRGPRYWRNSLGLLENRISTQLEKFFACWQ